jgi:hypothetical protein
MGWQVMKPAGGTWWGFHAAPLDENKTLYRSEFRPILCLKCFYVYET